MPWKNRSRKLPDHETVSEISKNRRLSSVEKRLTSVEERLKAMETHGLEREEATYVSQRQSY